MLNAFVDGGVTVTNTNVALEAIRSDESDERVVARTQTNDESVIAGTQTVDEQVVARIQTDDELVAASTQLNDERAVASTQPDDEPLASRSQMGAGPDVTLADRSPASCSVSDRCPKISQVPDIGQCLKKLRFEICFQPVGEIHISRNQWSAKTWSTEKSDQFPC